MELFFEVCRQKTHIMADTREGGTAADIKQIIAGVMQVSGGHAPRLPCRGRWRRSR